LRSTSGKVKTYRITFTDGDYFDYQVTDGSDASVTIVSSWNSTTSDSKVPSEKLTKDSLDAKANTGHTHTISNVTNLQTTLNNKANTSDLSSVALSNSYNDLDDVPSTFTPSSHSHAISDVTNLQTTLDGKASSTHTHTISDVTNLQTTLDGKASSSHSHSISDVTNLQSSLNAKANSSDLGTVATSNSYEDLDDIPSSFTPSSHTHAISEVTNLQTSLDAKAPKSHASSATTYGVGTTANYGHCKTVNSLTQSSHSNGLALSAYQGYVLKGLIDDLDDLIGDAITYINQ